MADDTATGAGTDYGTAGADTIQVFVSGSWTNASSATIPAGSTSVQVRTAITDDAIDEPSEAFDLTATRTAGTTTNASATGTGTIADDDGAPQIMVNDVTVNEAAGTLTFEVTLSAASGQTVTVDYATSDNTAVDPDDYTEITTTQLSFVAGDTSEDVVVTIANDSIFENSESFFIDLSNPSNATIADNQGEGTILDDGTGTGGTDNDTPTVSVDNVTVTEGTDTHAVFTVSLDNASSEDNTFSLALGR